MQETPITITFEYSEEEVVRALRAKGGKFRSVKIAIAVVIGVILFSALLLVRLDDSDPLRQMLHTTPPQSGGSFVSYYVIPLAPWTQTGEAQ